jgi:AAA domain
VRPYLLSTWVGSNYYEEDAQSYAETQRERRCGSLQPFTDFLGCCDIVFSTCAGAGAQVMRNAGKFDVILIDEAGQVTEPDALIPLWQNVSETTVVIIVGDTKQLGPTAVSQNKSVRKILGTSFMERIYAQNDQDTVSIDLTTQYRMNLEISQFISDTFYNSSIRSDTATSGTCLQLLKRKVSALCVDTSPFWDGMLQSIRGSSRLFLEEKINQVIGTMVKRGSFET